MDTPLIIDEEDPKWALWGKILGIMRSRRVKQEMAKQGIEPVAGVMFRIVLIAMFFSVEVSYVVEDLKRRSELRRFAHVVEIPRSSPDLPIPQSIQRRAVCWVCFWRAERGDREFQWGYSPSKGYYIGYKLTLAVEYPSLRPVAFLLHRGSPNDATLYEGILEELKRRRIARVGDTVIFNKGYYSYKNYLIGIAGFKITSLIFPRQNFKQGKLLGMLSYPLALYTRSNPDQEKHFYNRLVRRLKAALDRWEEYRPIRSMIEDIFKLTQDAFSLNKLRRYTERSVKKIVCLRVLLVDVVVSQGINSKEELQRIAEW
jgi:hypothetical protein